MPIRYLKITLDDKARFILRVTSETPRFIRGIEVNMEGDEVVPPGFDQRLRVIERARIAKAVELRMNPTYAQLEVVPKKTTAQLDAEIASLLLE
jgi:hypothetical protein